MEEKKKGKISIYGHGYVFKSWPMVFLVMLLFILPMHCNRSSAAEEFPGKMDKNDFNTFTRTINTRTNNTVDLNPLLLLTGKTKKAEQQDINQILAPYKKISKTSPMWPICTFLTGEVYRLHRDADKAREAYRALVDWASTDPYKDKWGGNGLAGIALWRWLQVLCRDKKLNHDEAIQNMDIAESLMESRLIHGMFSSDILIGLPQIEEDIRRRLAILSWLIGNKNRAQQFFLNYLMVASTAKLGPMETKLKDLVLSSGLATSDRLALFRAKRLYFLKRYDDAFELLNKSRDKMTQQVKVEADFYLAKIQRIKGKPREEIIKLLGSVVNDASDPDIAQEALFLRAILYNREGPGRDVTKFLEDISTLIGDFPRGKLADDALYEMARHYHINGNVEKALEYYEKLRNFKGKNDWINLASFHPAILLYTRGKPEDLKNAAKLLSRLNEKNPFGPLHLGALFWLGRIAAETGDIKNSGQYFKQIIKKSPYDYYAIRARMHLQMNRAASKELVPGPQTLKELKSAYLKSKANGSIDLDSPYHIRLDNALKTGLYSRTLSADRDLKKRFPSKRLEKLSLEELENSNKLVPISILLSLRQDALAAKDKIPRPGNRLQIAAGTGYVSGDWPLSINLTMACYEPYEKRWASQRSESYLATAYPLSIFKEVITRASKEQNVQSELLYSLIRRESYFYPAALSIRNAMGLFQFTPTTFNVLDKRWKLLETSGTDSCLSFLLDPERSINLGARWFKDELLKRHQGNVFLALIEHNAGYPALRDWIKMWTALGRSDDIEYMIETIRYSQTRIFMRGVLTDLAIVCAARSPKTKP